MSRARDEFQSDKPLTSETFAKTMSKSKTMLNLEVCFKLFESSRTFAQTGSKIRSRSDENVSNLREFYFSLLETFRKRKF